MTALHVTQNGEPAPQHATGFPLAIRRLRDRAASQITRVRPERWWLLLFTILFLAFFAVLLFQPTVGRGGR
jgi:uncharacterized membrane protein YhaH (DUF805 family)